MAGSRADLAEGVAVVLSSLLFAMAHNIYGFTAAFFGGMLLGLIYIQERHRKRNSCALLREFFILQRVLFDVARVETESFAMLPRTSG